jgi:SNF2 family DNA or RNA helicase
VKLEEISKGLTLAGVVPERLVTVVSVDAHGGESVELVYKVDGKLQERLLTRADEPSIQVAVAERPFSFDGDGASFQLACEAKRMDLAFLFDPMMAVHTANVEPLPHQITAVYESMLPRQPLRFVLADDPGAGKTIMAGLYVRELIMRADAKRVLIVAPGSLVEQWRDELSEKFGLDFRIFTSDLEKASSNPNPFEDYNQLIVRLDQMARNEELQEKLCKAGWDLVIFDEAHKLAAHFFGAKLEKTGRFRLAEKLGAATRHLLLMTATPHNGKEEDFQLFLSLLDSDRFYGKFRDGVHKVDTSDLMRRMVKEELVKFDNTPLFPERKAYTVNYTLSDLEAALYEAVTEYVRTEMGKADNLDGKRKGSVGFALTALQRRLASSPEAIYQSLRRRRERLQNRRQEEQFGIRGRQATATAFDIPEDDDDLDADEQETLEEAVIDDATAARTVAELDAEIIILADLEKKAKEVVASGVDRKWEELSQILQSNPQMRDANGRQRKIIIFSEHRDTLNYLLHKISGVLGNDKAVVTIHGGTHRDERRKVQALFRSDPEVRVLIATDAAGEGVNLQVANLMVNYDLPWNPNRLEQRFGRIHRIGQQEVCHLWNLVAKETREGIVYHRLLQKLEVESEALKGRVFDILGEVFEDTSLKSLLMDAIRYGDQPEVRARLTQQINEALDHDNLKSLLNRNALAEQSMTPDRLFAVKEEMDKAEARRLQPHFVRSFFLRAFEALGGTIHNREAGRMEITYVPAEIRERDRLITGRNRREQEPVLKRYDRVCFERSAIQPLDRPNVTRAVLMHPGHPLMMSLADVVIERNVNLLRQGAVFVDPADDGFDPSLLFLLTHEIRAHDGSVISKRMQFVRVTPDGKASFAGWAPHLDLVPLDASERSLLAPVVDAPWLSGSQEQMAISLAADTLAPQHFQEVSSARIAHVDKTLNAVNERLTKEISYWQDRWVKLSDDKAAGKDVALPLGNITRTLDDLQGRLDARKKELQLMRHIVNATPVAMGGALVIPGGLMSKLRGDAPEDPVAAMFAVDAAARARIEKIAMDAVRKAEEGRGCRIVDVSADKCGWDLTSYPPAVDGKQPEARHIEVKGRIKGATTVTVTHNEMLYAFNQGDKFLLAIVLVNEDDSVQGPHYLRNPFKSEPDWGVASVNYKLGELLARAEAA